MSSSTANADLQKQFERIEKKIGTCPHAPLVPTNILSGNQKPDKCRIHKCSCPECGYNIRVASKWLEMAMPFCPICDMEMAKELK